MSEVKNPQGTVTRRGFLKTTGGLLGAATVATAVPSSLSAFPSRTWALNRHDCMQFDRHTPWKICSPESTSP